MSYISLRQKIAGKAEAKKVIGLNINYNQNGFISEASLNQLESAFYDILVERYGEPSGKNINILSSFAKQLKKNKYSSILTLEELNNKKIDILKSLPDSIEELRTSLRTGITIESQLLDLGISEDTIREANLNKESLSWLSERYIKKTIIEIHPIEEAIEPLKYFQSKKNSLENLFKNDSDFSEYHKNIGINDIRLSGLTLDQIIILNNSIKNYEQGNSLSKTSINTNNIKPLDGEFVGKIDSWNLWLPVTQETSAKIAGYDPITKDPNTTWCTARTKGSNLFYNYVFHGETKIYLFYLIKDNPVIDDDWLSFGYKLDENNDGSFMFLKQNGGISVNKKNIGYDEFDFETILGTDIFGIVKQLAENKVKSFGGNHPAIEYLSNLSNDPSELKKAIWNRGTEERDDLFNKIIDLKSVKNPECIKIIVKEFFDKFILNYDYNNEKIFIFKDEIRRYGKELVINPQKLKEKLSNKELDEKEKIFIFLKDNNCLDKKEEIQSAIKVFPDFFIHYFLRFNYFEKFMNEKSDETNDNKTFLDVYISPYLSGENKIDICGSTDFLYHFSRAKRNKKQKLSKYLNTAIKNSIENDSFNFLFYFADEAYDWMRESYTHRAVSNLIKNNYNKESKHNEGYYIFLKNFGYKDWAKEYSDIFVKNIISSGNSLYFIGKFRNYSWAKQYLNVALRTLISNNDIGMLFQYRNEEWIKPYLNILYETRAKNDSFYFLLYDTDNELAKPHIDLAASILIKDNEKAFLKEFRNKKWANTPIESIGGKTWVEYAENMQKKSSYNNNCLIKLSTILINLGFNDYGYAVKKLSKY